MLNVWISPYVLIAGYLDLRPVSMEASMDAAVASVDSDVKAPANAKEVWNLAQPMN